MEPISSWPALVRVTPLRLRNSSMLIRLPTIMNSSEKNSTLPSFRKKPGNSVPAIMNDSETMAVVSTALLTMLTGMPASDRHSTMPMGAAISV